MQKKNNHEVEKKNGIKIIKRINWRIKWRLRKSEDKSKKNQKSEELWFKK